MDARSAPTPQTGGQIRLGRVFGIPLALDFRWFLIAALFTWMIVFEQEQGGGPRFSETTKWTVAALTALAAFVCLVAHELGHSLIARRHGLQVHGITLLHVGGVAMIQGNFDRPSAEVRMAAAGPLVTLAIWFLLFWTRFVFGNRFPAPLAYSIGWLANINLFWLIFNILPGFPMDGGRILRAILWARSGNQLRATRTAAAIGGGFGSVLIALGALNGIGAVLYARELGLALMALLPVYIGFYLRRAGRMELQQVALRTALEGVCVRDAMRAPAAVPSYTSVAEAVQRYLMPLGAEELPVEYYGQLMGTVGASQVRAIPWTTAASVPVYNVMRPLAPEDTIPPEVPLWDVLRGLAMRGRASALVIEDDRLVGMLMTRDILQMAQMRLTAMAPTSGFLPFGRAGR